MIINKDIKYCKNCFKEIKNNSFHSLINNDFYLCEDCLNKLKPDFINFTLNKVKGIALFNYEGEVKGKIFQYKYCEDYELKDIFLYFFKYEFKFMFDGYEIIPIPSYKNDDLSRGYNTVIEIFKCLNLPINNCIIKTENIKQKSLNYKERQNIGKYLTFENKKNLKGKKILIVDDVITTGATMKAVIELIKKENPKKIKILAIAKTKEIKI